MAKKILRLFLVFSLLIGQVATAETAKELLQELKDGSNDRRRFNPAGAFFHLANSFSGLNLLKNCSVGTIAPSFWIFTAATSLNIAGEIIEIAAYKDRTKKMADAYVDPSTENDPDKLKKAFQAAREIYRSKYRSVKTKELLGKVTGKALMVSALAATFEALMQKLATTDPSGFAASYPKTVSCATISQSSGELEKLIHVSFLQNESFNSLDKLQQTQNLSEALAVFYNWNRLQANHTQSVSLKEFKLWQQELSPFVESLATFKMAFQWAISASQQVIFPSAYAKIEGEKLGSLLGMAGGSALALTSIGDKLSKAYLKQVTSPLKRAFLFGGISTTHQLLYMKPFQGPNGRIAYVEGRLAQLLCEYSKIEPNLNSMLGAGERRLVNQAGCLDTPLPDPGSTLATNGGSGTLNSGSQPNATAQIQEYLYGPDHSYCLSGSYSGSLALDSGCGCASTNSCAQTQQYQANFKGFPGALNNFGNQLSRTHNDLAAGRYAKANANFASLEKGASRLLKNKPDLIKALEKKIGKGFNYATEQKAMNALLKKDLEKAFNQAATSFPLLASQKVPELQEVIEQEQSLAEAKTVEKQKSQKAQGALVQSDDENFFFFEDEQKLLEQSLQEASAKDFEGYQLNYADIEKKSGRDIFKSLTNAHIKRYDMFFDVKTSSEKKLDV